MDSHILAIDEGTTGSTAVILRTDGTVVGRGYKEFTQHFPEPGWVEHDAEDIWQAVQDTVAAALKSAGLKADGIDAIGITNQRETTLIWDRKTDKPVHRAIVWQDRRTSDQCDELKGAGHEATFKRKTGLVLDPYFSGTKIAWLLDNVEGVRERAEDYCFGTIDSFLVWRLAGGAKGQAPHVTDVTNASRTLLMDLKTQEWSPKLCEILRVPPSLLPKIVGCAEVVAHTKGFPGLADGIPISGIAGDQQAALFGQACFEAGEAKCTYGTGAFVVMNTGSKIVRSRHGLLSTVAWRVDDDTTFALEGSCFIAGAAVQWLRDAMGIIQTSPEVEELASQVDSSEGVMFVPALAGLGAPYWDARARGLICGITRGTTRAHLARATLEAIAYQVVDLIYAMAEDQNGPMTRLRVDGGAAANDLLMQMQADFAGLTVERPTDLESTARGAAMLAGVGSGLFEHGGDAARMFKIQDEFHVTMAASERDRRLGAWRDAVRRARV
jgi:glycerol kinase